MIEEIQNNRKVGHLQGDNLTYYVTANLGTKGTVVDTLCP